MNRRKPNRSEAGFTLVELLVVLTLLGVVGGIVTSAIVTSLSSARNTQTRIEALNELEIALQRVTRDLRAAEELVLYPPDVGTDLGAEVRRDGTRTIVRYRLLADDERFVREDTGQILVTRVDNPVDQPIFAYLDRFGNPLDCVADNCGNAAVVQVRLIRETVGQPVIVETRVAIRNVRYGG
jgi:prepilin-type N-terminal cleavage/methylation domain-containing protein